LLAETDLKEAFIAAHTLKPEVTHSVEGSKLSKREVSSSQTQGGSVLLPNVDPANFAEDAMKCLFQQYHTSCILPQMEFLRTGSDVMWTQVGNQFSSVFAQLLSHQQQLGNIEKQMSRRTVTLKVTEQPTLQVLKYNLQSLCKNSWVLEDMIQDKVNHYVPGLGFYVFVTMVTEAAKGHILKTLKNGFWWKPCGMQHFKLKFEDHVTPTDRLLMQPFYAILDLVTKSELIPVEEVRSDKRFMQVYRINSDESKLLLAQVLYVPGNAGYRALILVHSQLQSALDSFPGLIQSRLASARLVIQAEKSAFHQGCTRTVPTWHLQFDHVTSGHSFFFSIRTSHASV
jgi:hypothetical protein